MSGDAASTDTRLSVRAPADAPAWYLFNESGFDRAPPKAQQANGLEVIRDYLDAKGNVVTTLTQGQEVTVRLRARAIGDVAYGSVAIVDLLPGGFEAVLQTPPQATAAEAVASEGDEYEEGDEGYEDATESNAAPVPVLALAGTTLGTEHEEVREDRIVLYAFVTTAVKEFRYTVRANNIGTFVVPPVYGEAMYRPSVYAQGGPAGTLTVTAPKK